MSDIITVTLSRNEQAINGSVKDFNGIPIFIHEIEFQ